LRVGHDVPQWPIQLLLGIVLWNFFAEVTNNGVTAIVNRGDVIRKINFPKYVIVLASSISALINLLINLIVIAIFMIINGVDLRWEMLLSPLYIGELFMFAIGLAFFLSSTFVKLRDINYIWEIIMQGLFYASIVIYPITLIIAKGEQFAKLLLLNPIAQSIQDTRHALISKDAHTLYGLVDGNLIYAAAPVIFVFTVFVLGAWIFKKNSPRFAENVYWLKIKNQ
jgi:ABC-2 type transport system permease protein